jgi:hypothetical protein
MENLFAYYKTDAYSPNFNLFGFNPPTKVP